MLIVQIDVLDAQPVQGLLNLFLHIFRSSAGGPITPYSKLGGQEYLASFVRVEFEPMVESSAKVRGVLVLSKCTIFR